MVGGTRFHRWIHEASLGRNAGQRKDSFREEGKKRALAARTVQVSLDRADAIIEAAPCFCRGKPENLQKSALYLRARLPHLIRSKMVGYTVYFWPGGEARNQSHGY